jgi:hypothetical protein
MEAIMADKEKGKPAQPGNQQRDDAFAPAPADGNVFPAGAPQTSHGSATGPIHSPTGSGASRQQPVDGEPGSILQQDRDAEDSASRG